MNVKQKVLTLIKKSQLENNQYLSTTDLAEKLGLKRNTVSHYLNQLVKENELIKINTRPAVFIFKKIAEKKSGCVLDNEYGSVKELQKKYRDEDVFNNVIGHNKSLYSQIKKLKAAA